MVLYLAYASFFVLKEVCPLCVTTYVAVIGAFVISGGASSVAMSKLPMRVPCATCACSWSPRRSRSSSRSLFVAGGVVGGMTVFPRESDRAAVRQQLPALTRRSVRRAGQRWWDVQPKLPNFPFDNGGAKVLIVEFADFQCPHCQEIACFALQADHRQVSVETNPKDVTFLFKTWPLQLATATRRACRPPTSRASCDASGRVIRHGQRRKGTADKLKDWFFTHQEELSPASVRRAAVDVGKITDFDASYDKAIQEVKTDAAVGTSLQVHSTPTFFINGRGCPAAASAPQYLDSLIQLALSRAK